MGGMKITALDFLRLLPAFMRDDEAAIALSEAMNQLLGDPGKRLHTIRTWDKIGELSEAECDELAWELDVDWYDSAGMSLEEKRATLQLAQQIKRKRGTKWAVENLISAYLGDGFIEEWYETGGKPYTFVLTVTSPTITAEQYEQFFAAVQIAKNERSRLAGVLYLWEQGPDPGVECALGSELHRYGFKKCGTHNREATLGAAVKSSVETEPEASFATYSFPKCGTRRCGQ